MYLDLPAPIAGFFQAHNSGQTDTLLDHFTADAVVTDESRDHCGEAIRVWLSGVIAQYHPLRAEVTGLTATGNVSIVTALVSGSFPGSPVVLRYSFTLRGDRIAALRIAV